MSLLPPHYLSAVLSIEVEKINDKGESIKVPIATGFFLGKQTPSSSTTNEPQYRIFLVTNRHVFEDVKRKEYLPKVQLRHNTANQQQQTKYYEVALLDVMGKPIWFRHPNENVDIAVLPVNGKFLLDEGIDFYFFREDTDVFQAKHFAEKGISTGDGLFVLGFPMGIRGEVKNFVIVRQGIIARVDDEVLKNHFFFIDASAYPGNSGGPVICKPELAAIQGTKNNLNAGLIGVISNGVTYSETAVSQQTGEPRIIFTEQTGLIRIVPMESVLEAINEFDTAQTVVANATDSPAQPISQ